MSTTVEQPNPELPCVHLRPDERTVIDLRIARLKEDATLRQILEDGGFTIESTTDGAFVRDYACGACDVKILTRKNRGPMRYRTGSYGGYADPCSLECDLCRHHEDAPAVYRRLYGASAKQLDRYPISNLPAWDFDVVRCKTKRAIGVDFADAALEVVPASFDPMTDIEAVRVVAPTKELVAAALQDGLLDDYFKVVPCTPYCEPRHNWHGQRMNATEQSRIDRVELAEKRRRQIEFEREMAELRLQRAHELGL